MMDEYPIDVGSMLFTMVDPHRGHEVEYNRWYERDHFYAGCMIGPGILSGSRWVATRQLKDLRFPSTSPFAEPVDAGSYLAIYWINRGQDDEWGAWASDQVWWLYQNDRGFAERTHAQTGLYDALTASNAPGHPVPLPLALDHRYASLHVVVAEPTSGTAAELADAMHAGPLDDLLATGSAALVSSWKVKSARDTGSTEEQTSPMPLGASGGSRERVVQLMFSERAAEDAWDDVRAYAEGLDARGIGRVTFAAPFHPTDVGTDRYTDELW